VTYVRIVDRTSEEFKNNVMGSLEIYSSGISHRALRLIAASELIESIHLCKDLGGDVGYACEAVIRSIRYPALEKLDTRTKVGATVRTPSFGRRCFRLGSQVLAQYSQPEPEHEFWVCRHAAG
jgi:hypothetical protein